MKAGTAQLEPAGSQRLFPAQLPVPLGSEYGLKDLLGVETGSRWEQSHAPVGETLTQGQRVEAQPLTTGGVLTPSPLWQQAA